MATVFDKPKWMQVEKNAWPDIIKVAIGRDPETREVKCLTITTDEGDDIEIDLQVLDSILAEGKVKSARQKRW